MRISSRNVGMGRAVAAVAIASVALVGFSASPASAKGASAAILTGDGVVTPIHLEGEALMAGDGGGLVDLTGLYSAVYGGDEPSSLTDAQPTTDLGRHLLVTWTMAPDSTVTQDLYPDAAGGPLVHTAAAPPVLSTSAHGGWFRAPEALRTTVDNFIRRPPATTSTTAASTTAASGTETELANASVTPPGAAPDADGNGLRWALVIGGVVLAAAAAVVTVRRVRR